jgi:Stage II sporulation protein/Carboxypeptidase regulatory-like domain
MGRGPTTNDPPGRARPGFVPLALAVGVLATVAAARPAGATPATGTVRGDVVSRAGRPVAGATVTLPDLGVSATSGRDGSFAFAEPLPTQAPYRRIRAVVRAAGFGTWRITGAPLYPGDTLELHAELGREAFTHAVLTPRERTDHPDRQGRSPGPASPATAPTCTGWTYQLTPPPTIWVYRHATDVSEQYDFEFYVAHVLPNEWISSWDADALAAGAVAVKTYAAYRTMPGHAVSSGDGCADIRDDTYDQVFDPTWSTASTDQAVHATFGSIAYRDGGLFLAQYYAGSSDDPCAVVTGTFAGRMSQWGTQTCGVQKVLWPEIVPTFYAGATWHYQGNLLLNPSFDSPPTYPWTAVANTSYARTKNGAYAGTWYLAVTPTVSGRNAIVRQEVPWNGTTATTYHAAAGLRCRSTQGACSISVKVVSVPSTGSSVTRTLVVSVPKDGAWHAVHFDPPAAGIAHTQAWLSFVAVTPFDFDGTLLQSAYGGP